MNQVELSAKEIKDYLEYIVANNQHIQSQGKTPIAVEIIGESGLGKTSISLQLADTMGLNHVKLNLAQIEELGDLIGFPMRQFQMRKGGVAVAATEEKIIKKIVMENGQKVVKQIRIPAKPASTGGITKWIDEVAVDQYASLGYEFTEKKRMSYCAPEWIADKEGGGFLILDDWNRADTRFLQAVMDLIDRQEYISWKLPKNWHIVLTANPDDGNYIVNTQDVAQKTRYMSTVMKWDLESWAEWAEKNGIDSRCINFMLMHEEIVKGAVNPRSITNFFNSISSIEEFEDRMPLIQQLGEGSVGPEVATMFSVFINNRMDKWMTPKAILETKDDKAVVDALHDMFGTGDDKRADIACVLTTRLINHTLFYAEKHPITPEIIDRLTMLIKEEDLFTDDLKYILVKKILNGNKQKFQKLLMDTTVQELATK
jgi:hypothetical protein